MSKHDLIIDPPLMNAAGSLGFTPSRHLPMDWSRLGAFVINPVSLLPRTPAHGQRFITFPGGFLLHTGYPNPGLRQVLRHYARYWQRSPIPVIVHLLARDPDEVTKIVRQLEAVEGVSALEVGIAPDTTLEMVEAFTQAAGGELPAILRLPMEHCMDLAPGAMRAGASAVSLAPPRGSIPHTEGELVQGRMYGPSVFPLALRMVQELSQLGIPTIGSGGVYTKENVDAMLAAGAMAIQLDSIVWRGAGYTSFT